MNETGSDFQPVTTQWPIYHNARLQGVYDLFYAPGYVAVVPSAKAAAFREDVCASDPHEPIAVTLRQHARRAKEARFNQTTSPFRPICLTLYLHNECNLHCSYCFAEPSRSPQPRLQLSEIHAAAELVLKNCCERRRPFTLVFHGGGEPSLHKPLLEAALDALEQMAAAHNVPIFRYIATNGMMSPVKAKWLAQRFDLVGLSCDGPPEIHNLQRPTWHGQGSSQQLEKTAEIIGNQGTPLHIRVTLSPATFGRQTEIAHYLCRTLQPVEIHVEPIYRAGRAAHADCHLPEQADQFVNNFYLAQQVARQYGVTWSISGSRPNEIHGAYCHVFRDVLNLVPGGVATACFQTVDKTQVDQLQVNIGAMQNNRFILAEGNIAALRQQKSVLPDVCRDCFNQFHCTRACPNQCPSESDSAVDAFYCAVQKKLIQTHLSNIARSLWAKKKENNVIIGSVIERLPF